MKHKTFVIPGRTPSKKNSRTIFVRHGRIENVPSKSYAKWHKISGYRMIEQGSLRFKAKIIFGIEIIFYFPDKRRSDLTNKAESVMDLLVDCRVIPDDSWQIVSSLTLYAMGVDKKNPRAEVNIRYA